MKEVSSSSVWLVSGWAVNIVFRLYFHSTDNSWWCACPECNAVLQAAAKSTLRPKKSTLHPTPSFLRLIFIHYEARLVEGGSRHPVPPCMPANFLMKPPHTFWQKLFLYRDPEVFYQISPRLYRDKNFRYVDFLPFEVVLVENLEVIWKCAKSPRATVVVKSMQM